jgi:hypothetical protein
LPSQLKRLTASRLLKKAELQAASFDKLTMRWSDFNGLDLTVSLPSHGLHRFAQPASP